jgi:hypothetical protein
LNHLQRHLQAVLLLPSTKTSVPGETCLMINVFLRTHAQQAL